VGDNEGAIREYRLAIAAVPDYFEAHLKLAQLLLARGDIAGAAPHLRKAAESPDPRIRNASAPRP
jgi:hypothetical protein